MLLIRHSHYQQSALELTRTSSVCLHGFYRKVGQSWDLLVGLPSHTFSRRRPSHNQACFVLLCFTPVINRPVFKPRGFAKCKPSRCHLCFPFFPSLPRPSLELHCLRGNTTSSPLVQIMKPTHGRFIECIYFLVVYAASVHVPEFSRHISTGFFRRGTPMEVIDDCTFFSSGILPHTLRQTDTSRSPPQKKPVVLKLYSSFMSTRWCPRPWVEYEYHPSLHSNSNKGRAVLHSTQLNVIRGGPGWVELSTTCDTVLNSTHDNQRCTQTQLI